MEDIKNLKEIVDLCEKEIKNNDDNTTAILDIADLKSLKNILNELDRLKKENEELREQVNMFDEAYSGAIKESKKWFDIAHDSIPKLVIQDKIDVLEKIQKEFKNNEELRIKIITYKELLNKGE